MDSIEKITIDLDSAQRRIEDVTRRMAERGVVTLGMTFSPGAKDALPSHLMNQVADFFEAALNGDGRVLTDEELSKL